MTTVYSEALWVLRCSFMLTTAVNSLYLCSEHHSIIHYNLEEKIIVKNLSVFLRVYWMTRGSHHAKQFLIVKLSEKGTI